jgi:hypothetical protein
MSRFLGLTVNSPSRFPTTPERPAVDLNGVLLDPLLPVSSQGNPRWYYKWLRMIPTQNLGWNRNFYLPPGASTPIMIDQSMINGYKETCAWCMYIAQPELDAVTITLYDLIDPTITRSVSTSQLQRPDVIPTVKGMFCQIDNFPEQEDSNAVAVESWNMTQGSAVLHSGQHYYQITNTGTTAVCLVTLSSFSHGDLSDLLAAPTVTAHRAVNYNWNAQ